jgi:hypothetical protein
MTMFSFRMMSDTKIECQHATQEWKAASVGAVSGDRSGIEPGGANPFGLDGFSSRY